MSVTFAYGEAHIKDIVVQSERDASGRTRVKHVHIDGRPTVPSSRFWNSLHVRFGFTSNIFKYFSHAEVFNRISEVSPQDRIRWCLEIEEGKPDRLLGVSNPQAAIIRHEDLHELLGRYDTEEVRYGGGMVRSTHAPRLGGPFQIGGDNFRNKFVIETPIDGYGRPAVYLAMVRLICSNGAVAYTPAFRNELNIGRAADGVSFALMRVLEGFNNEDGYAAMRQRFESATRSWASVNEVNRLYRLLARLQRQDGPSHEDSEEGQPKPAARPQILIDYQRMTGDLSQMYGLTNPDTLSVKRQRTLPAACKVYDLLNFSSEMATHHADVTGARALHGFIGEMISSEFDLEGTVDTFEDWRDFFISNEATAETLSAMNQRGRA